MGIFDSIKNSIKEQTGDLLGVTGLTQRQQPVETAPIRSQAPAAPAPTSDGLYNPQIEKLIDMALADGELTEKEKQVLFKRAQAEGIDLDEFEMVLDAKLHQINVGNNAQPSPNSAPQSNKYGDVKKCPACGAMIQSFTTHCPECGHEFSNIAANSSIQKLFEMLNQVEAESREDAKGLMGVITNTYGDMFSSAIGGNKDTRKKKAIIRNFPIPTTKDDILEFLSLAVPLARKPKFISEDRQIRMFETWHAKCEQIIIKSKFSMRDDKQALEMIAEYAKELKIKM